MTITFRDGDIDAIYRDLAAMGGAVPISINGVAGTGIVDENDQVVIVNAGRGEVVGGVHTVTIQTSKFPGVREGMQIIVDGITASVRQKLKEGDAGLTKILIGDSSGITIEPPDAGNNSVVKPTGDILLLPFQNVILCTGTLTVTLPIVPSQTTIYHINHTGSGVATVVPSSGLIDGQGTFPLSGVDSIDLIFDGTNWRIL
jgi:hypothetical protein